MGNNSFLNSNKKMQNNESNAKLFSGIPGSNFLPKSPKVDLIKKNKSDDYQNEIKPEYSGFSNLKEDISIKNNTKLRNSKAFNEDHYKSPYKLGFQKDFDYFTIKKKQNEIKNEKENLQPANPFKSTKKKTIESEKINNFINSSIEQRSFPNLLVCNKNKKEPVITTIQLYKPNEKNDENPLNIEGNQNNETPKDINFKQNASNLKSNFYNIYNKK